MSEPRTHTLDVPGARLRYDIRDAERGAHRATWCSRPARPAAIRDVNLSLREVGLAVAL